MIYANVATKSIVCPTREVSMEITYICEFVTLAETCNYMEAADRLFISQSALSRHIKALEEDLEVQLFDRSTRKVSLSRFGALFLPYAKQIAATRFEYESAISTEKKADHGSIRIGSIPVMSQYHITDLLADFQKENPAVSMDVIEGDSVELMRLLRSGQCDLAFLREGQECTDEFNIVHFDSDQMTAIMSVKHPLARRSFIPIELLRNEPLILLSQNTYMYSICIDACKKAGFTPQVALTMHRASNMLDLARKGMGIVLLNRKPIRSALTEDLVAIDIEPRIITNIDLAYPKNRKLSPGARRFIDMVNIGRK